MCACVYVCIHGSEAQGYLSVECMCAFLCMCECGYVSVCTARRLKATSGVFRHRHTDTQTHRHIPYTQSPNCDVRTQDIVGTCVRLVRCTIFQYNTTCTYPYGDNKSEKKKTDTTQRYLGCVQTHTQTQKHRHTHRHTHYIPIQYNITCTYPLRLRPEIIKVK